MSRIVRERRQGDEVGEVEPVDVQPVDVETSAARVERLPELVQSMGATPAFQRPELARRINDLLIAMRAPGHEEEESELIVELLTTKVLNDSVDTLGRSCRKEAVETLMACGFPHALLLAPEDAEFARTWRQSNEPATLHTAPEWEELLVEQRRGGARLIIVGQVLGEVVALRSSLSLPKQIVVGVLSLIAVALAVLIAKRRPRELNIGVVGVALTVTLIAQLLAWGWTNSGGPVLGVMSIGIGLFLATGAFGANPIEPFDPDAPYWGSHSRDFDDEDYTGEEPKRDPWGRDGGWNYGREPTYAEIVPNPKGDFWRLYEQKKNEQNAKT